MWAEFMYWLLFFISMYWFIAYKMTEEAAILLPSIDDIDYAYRNFYIIFGIVLLFRVIVIVLKIIESSTVDVFLIDWEKPQEKSD